MARRPRGGFYTLPAWVDNAGYLARHAGLRLRRRCITCGLPGGAHKLDCYHSHRIRDDVLFMVPRLHAWLVRCQDRHG